MSQSAADLTGAFQRLQSLLLTAADIEPFLHRCELFAAQASGALQLSFSRAADRESSTSWTRRWRRVRSSTRPSAS